jgi:hypothetical protein
VEILELPHELGPGEIQETMPPIFIACGLDRKSMAMYRQESQLDVRMLREWEAHVGAVTDQAADLGGIRLTRFGFVGTYLPGVSTYISYKGTQRVCNPQDDH